MRLKLLLAMLTVSGGLLMAQDTIKTLVITEARFDRAEQAFIEITNMGTEALNLSDFEFGTLTPWDNLLAVEGTDPVEYVPWPAGCPQIDNHSIERLPDLVLAPGESYVIGVANDFTEENYARDVELFGWSQDWGQEFLTSPKLMDLIDLQVHAYESPGGTNAYGDSDSTSASDIPRLNYATSLEDWNGRGVHYLRHHISPTDSAIIDQIGWIGDEGDGTNPDAGYVDVAGVEGALGGSYYLMRRFDVKQGNPTFVTGIDLTDSEWIPIPHRNTASQYGEKNSGPFWTVGNHVNAQLTDLSSSTLDLDLITMTITVPWGVRNNDSIMGQIDWTPGIAWHYDYAPSHEDSAYASVRTGDILTLYAVGNTLQTASFALQVLDPPANENRVVPKYHIIDENNAGDNPERIGSYEGAGIPYDVTDDLAQDIISELPFACRVDSLMKYLELPPKATYEFVWVDGVERTDLMEGDLLRITAEDGTSVKDYYLDLQNYRESRDARLSSITWPDIPEFYKGIFGWLGDTIPGFAAAVENYVVQVPADVDGIPALVGKTWDANATMEVDRAVNLFGSAADRTVTFTVAAENDTTITEYTVQLEKQKKAEHVQPWAGEPFFSQIVFRDQWSNGFMEIVNPGTDAIDMSDYLISFHVGDNPADAITSYSGVVDYDTRYTKYIPGRIWADTVTWAADPGKAVQDLNVNTTVYPGDVFVIADINSTGQSYASCGYGGEGNWQAEEQADINMGEVGRYPNPWESPPGAPTLDAWWGVHFYLYKIIGEGGDSVRNGTKAANDPNDFLLLDTWGGEGTEQPTINGELMDQTTGYVRKPQYYAGKTGLAESWGTDHETSEWIMTNRPYFNSIGVGWCLDILRICDGLGSHFMNEVTVYRSTVASLVYKVTTGYSMDEEIRGATTGTTVDYFLLNLIKADEGQALMVKSGGVEITGATALAHGDSLYVVSADLVNTSRYHIEVTDEGLSDDAVLTSTSYTILFNPAVLVTGFEIGTLLKDVVAGVDVPAGAAMNVIDVNDAYVPLKTINFDTMYVDVMATSVVYFEVIAEDGLTKIVYQLMPLGDASDAYVTSSVFEVDQDALLIGLIPEATTVGAFLSNLVPATGATWVLLDKLGHERTEGIVVQDDRLIVTAADGVTTKTYYLSMLEEIANYLAYVISDVYLVDQEGLTISGASVTGDVSVADFTGNLTPAVGATMEVQDNAGSGKADADMLADEDMLQVTAGNGVNVVTYAIELDHTGIGETPDAGVRIYPNPSTGQLYVEGAEPGNRIHLYNTVGVALRDVTVFSGVEAISLDDQPDGMYFITISDGESVVGHYKVIKQ